MPTLYLHIGTPKTGTTALQNFLPANEEVLEQHGIVIQILDSDMLVQVYTEMVIFQLPVIIKMSLVTEFLKRKKQIIKKV